jgi:hypothetical protein
VFTMVNSIMYTPVADIVDYFTNVSKKSGPIECTSFITQISINLGYSDLAYIEGDVPILSFDQFVHVHILREEPDYSISMSYGHKGELIWRQHSRPSDYSISILFTCTSCVRNLVT